MSCAEAYLGYAAQATQQADAEIVENWRSVLEKLEFTTHKTIQHKMVGSDAGQDGQQQD